MLTILDGVKVGIQSWCFRGLQGNTANITALKECGVDAIELCGIHVNVSDAQNVDEVVKLYNENGITIHSCGIDHYPNDEAKIRNLFEFAKKANVKVAGADPDPDAFALIDKLCDEYGVKIAIHNHGRHHRYGFAKQLEEVFATTSKNIGLCIDTGWVLDSKECPIEWIHKFADRLYGVHLKDFNFDEEGKEIETVLGTGELDLPGVLNALKEVGFNGYATLEYEGEPENPIPNIIKCLSSLK